jgi:hypothetical protein
MDSELDVYVTHKQCSSGRVNKSKDKSFYGAIDLRSYRGGDCPAYSIMLYL